MRRLLLIFSLSAYAAVANANCGVDFDEFLTTLKQDAHTIGYSKNLIKEFFTDVKQNPKVLRADQNQEVFQKDFIKFSQLLISDYRITHAKKNATKYKDTFDKIEKEFGISSGVLLAL